jgi:hypothetical protein
MQNEQPIIVDNLRAKGWEGYFPIKCKHTENIGSATLYYRLGKYVVQKQELLDFFVLFYVRTETDTLHRICNITTEEELYWMMETSNEIVNKTPITIERLEAIGYSYNPNLYQKELYVIMKKGERRVKIFKNITEGDIPLEFRPSLYLREAPHPIIFLCPCSYMEDIDKMWEQQVPIAKAAFRFKNCYAIDEKPTPEQLMQKYELKSKKAWAKFHDAEKDNSYTYTNLNELMAIAEQAEETFRDLCLLNDHILETYTKKENSEA